MSTIVLDARKLDDFGIGTYVRGLVSGLAALGDTGDYVLAGDPERCATLELPSNFRFVRDRSAGYSARELWSLARTARRAGAALYHAPHYVLPYGLPCPAVVTVHDLIHLRFERPALERLYARRTIRRALRTAASTIAVSDTTRRELVESFGGTADRVVVVPNGVDERFRRPVPAAELDQARRYLGLPDDYLLFVGNPLPHKNLPLALAAHARLAVRHTPPPPLVLCGVTSEAAAAAASHAGIDRRATVHALGRVDDGWVPSIYAGARIVLVPSRWEGFGLTAAEALAAGRAVIAARTGALPEVVGDAGLLVDGEDPEAWAAAISSLLDDAEKRAALELAGPGRAARFRWTETARATRTLYDRILSRPRGSE